MTFTELLDEFNIPHREAGQHHHASTGWLQIDCPYCSPNSQRYRMGYNLNRGNLNCWTCGSHPLAATLVLITGQPWLVIKGLLGSLESEFAAPQKQWGKLKLPSHVSNLHPAHVAYLKGRGFDPEKLQKLWKIQGISIAPKLSWRIFIPIIYGGNTVSWTTRAIGSTGQRYIAARPEEEAINAKALLYGMDLVRHAIVVCEGPTDCWRIGPGAVATLGVNYTRAQVKLISEIPTRIVCFDSESEAQRRANKLCNDLESFPGETYKVTLSGKDAGEASQEEIAELRKEFLTWTVKKWN